MEMALLDADRFAAALAAIPADDWIRTWAAHRTIMLRRTSKGVKEGVDKMRPPTVAKLSRAFWNNARNGTAAEKLQHMLADLEKMASRCRITTLNLEGCGMSGQDAGRLPGVLPQCPELSLLNLGGNRIGAAGAEYKSLQFSKTYISIPLYYLRYQGYASA